MKKEQQRSWAMTVAGLVIALGLGLIVRGAWLAWRPGGWMLAGALIALPALLVAYGAYRSQ